MTPEEWKVIEKHTQKFCLYTSPLFKAKGWDVSPDKCNCVFHKLIQELRIIKPKAKKGDNAR